MRNRLKGTQFGQWLDQRPRMVLIVGVVAAVASAVIQTGDLAQMFRSPWAWLLNIIAAFCALWLRREWLIIFVIIVFFWPLVVVVPLFALTFGAP